ncbi:MAG: hypothetical protein FWF44_08490, partial [Defluviitaleaceae bacterium]|nr:hypothetical protein [Defluviitaleaceae bacterium]
MVLSTFVMGGAFAALAATADPSGTVLYTAPEPVTVADNSKDSVDVAPWYNYTIDADVSGMQSNPVTGENADWTDV